MIQCINILLEHNFACREPLLNAIAQLNNEDFTRDMKVGFSSIRGILIHLMKTELFWISVVSDQEMPPISDDDFVDVESIRKAWQEIERDTRRFVEYQSENSFQHVKNVTWDDQTVSFTVAKAIIHMATHETHHRGLIIGLMKQLGHATPDVDMM